MAKQLSIPVVGDVIGGKFLLLSRLGSGGFGVVYKAKDQRSGRTVAIKMLHPSAENLKKDVTDRFTREIQLVVSLNHPGIVTIFEVSDHDGLPFYAMEYLEGRTLQQVIAHRFRTARPFTADQLHDVLKQILSALCVAHTHPDKIIHRDLKPENIMIEGSLDRPMVKILDFGIAKALSSTSEHLTRSGMIAGTAEVMAPEQAQARPLTTATDVYAVGCLIYMMVTGEAPYGGTSPLDVALKHITDPVPCLPNEWAGGFFDALMQECLSKDASDRPQDAAAVLERLRAYEPTGALVTPRLSEVRPTPVVDRAITNLMPALSDERGAPKWPLRLAVVGGVLFLLATCFTLAWFALEWSAGDGKPQELAAADNGHEPDVERMQDTEVSAVQLLAEPKADAQAPPDFVVVELVEEVTVSSMPRAMVWRDTQKLGWSPITLTRATYGDAPMSLSLRKSGYKDAEVQIDWSGTQVSVSLERIERPSGRDSQKRVPAGEVKGSKDESIEKKIDPPAEKKNDRPGMFIPPTKKGGGNKEKDDGT